MRLLGRWIINPRQAIVAGRDPKPTAVVYEQAP
jgi:hypothetical protein